MNWGYRLKPGSVSEAQVQQLEAEFKSKLEKVGWLPNFYSLPPQIHIANSMAYKEGKVETSLSHLFELFFFIKFFLLFYCNFLHIYCLGLVIQIYGIDAASGAAVSALNVFEGDHVLDLCAAPGNLLSYIAFVDLIKTLLSVQVESCSQILFCSRKLETQFRCRAL